MSKLIPALVAAATIAVGSAAYAQTGTAPAPNVGGNQPMTNAPSGKAATKPMTEAEVRQELQKQGYTNVSNVKKQGEHFEANAMKDGKRVALEVDAKSGKIVTR